MTTKIKLKAGSVTPNSQGLVPLGTLAEGDWFAFGGSDGGYSLAVGVIVDGKPFYPWWKGKAYRGTYSNSTTLVRRIKTLIIQESCRG